MGITIYTEKEDQHAQRPQFSPGSGTAIVTPYTETGVDYAKYEESSRCSTPGTSATGAHDQLMMAEEHNKLTELTVKRCAGRMKVIVGVGSNNTEHALEQAKHAEGCGADGILMVTPYYKQDHPGRAHRALQLRR